MPTSSVVTAAVLLASGPLAAEAMVIGRAPVPRMMSETTEAAAKARWLARLDLPFGTTGMVTPTAAATAVAEAPTTTIDYEAAKAKWLASLDDEPSWKKSNTVTAETKTIETPIVDPVEEAAKLRWLASLDQEPSWLSSPAVTNLAEEAAKRAWLASLNDEPIWLQPARHAVTATVAASMAKMTEEEAKAAWLARLDAPTWGPAESAPAVTDSKAAEEAAKAAWLSRLDVPSWGPKASQVEALAEDCRSGDDVACEVAAREAEAKAIWLKKLEDK